MTGDATEAAKDARTAARHGHAVLVPIEATWRVIQLWSRARARLPALPADPRRLSVRLDAGDVERLEAFSPSRYWALDLNDRAKLVDATLPLIMISRETKARPRLARVLLGLNGERRARTVAPINGDPLDLRRANLQVVWTGDLRARSMAGPDGRTRGAGAGRRTAQPADCATVGVVHFR